MKSKVFTALLSVLLAFGMWLYVVTVVAPDYEDTIYDVPVVMEGQSLLTEKGLMVTENKTPTVDLKLSGSRSDLNKLNTSNLKAVVKVSQIAETGEQQLNFTVTYPLDLIDGAISIVEKYPKVVTLHIERRISKEIQIVPVYNGTVPQDFIADKENVELDYTSVTITGPESVIEQITQARVEVDLTGRTESFSESFRFRLCDVNGEPVNADKVEAEIAEVNLTMRIQRVKEIPLTLNIIPGGGATDKTSNISIDPLTIKVSGSDKLLEELTELNLGTINLGEITEGTFRKTLPINLPAGVTNLTGVTEATVVITFPKLQTHTFRISRINAINVPEGYEAEVITQELEVKVRGPVDLIRQMNAGDITVTVDFAGALPGTATMKATVTMSAGFSEVGALGSYNVSATLREIAAEDLE